MAIFTMVSARASGVPMPSGLYQSTTELSMPKTRRGAETPLMSVRMSPSSCARAIRAPSWRVKSRRRRMAASSTSEFPRRRSSSVT